MKKVLIVKDIQALIEKEQSFLNRSDVTMVTVSSNEQALDLYRAERADLIIAKLDAPGMSGEVLCSLIREDKELRNVSLMLVCPDSESRLKRCLKCRANAFITMPINNAVFLRETRRLLHIAERKLFRVPLSIKIFGKSSNIPFIGYAENISATGMLLHSDTFLSERTMIVCSFYLPDSSHITSRAEVIRALEKETEHDTNCYGVKFIGISREFSSAIEAFAERERPRP